MEFNKLFKTYGLKILVVLLLLGNCNFCIKSCNKNIELSYILNSKDSIENINKNLKDSIKILNQELYFVNEFLNKEKSFNNDLKKAISDFKNTTIVKVETIKDFKDETKK